MSMRTRLILVLLISLAAYTVTLADVAYGVQALAALILCGLLPGALLVDLAVGRSAAPPTRAERIVLSVGMGYAALVLGMLLLSYLPGPLQTWQVYTGYGALAAALLALIWRRDRVREYPPGRVIGDGIEADFPRRRAADSRRGGAGHRAGQPAAPGQCATPSSTAMRPARVRAAARSGL